jgi:dipeptidyl aminopeptidase/acylaminoacyl peptidase
MARLATLLAALASLAVPAQPGAAEPRTTPPAATAPAEPTGLARFVRHPRFFEAKISPNGTYLAAVTLSGGIRTLAFVNLATRAFVSRITPSGETMVGNFHWVSDERVVMELVHADPGFDAPRLYGELYAAEVTGKNGRLVYGYRAGEQTGHIKGAEMERGWGFFLDTLRDDDRHVLIETTPWDEPGDHLWRIEKLDVVTGARSPVTVSPVANSEFVTDENGEPRITFAEDAKLNQRFFFREPGQPWRELEKLAGFDRNSVALGFAAKDRIVFLVEPGSGFFGLYAVSIDTGERKLVSRNDRVPPSSLVLDGTTHRVVAVEYDPDVPSYDFVQPDHPLAKALKGALDAFPEDHVHFVNVTRDQKKALLRVFSDRNPGKLLLVDVEKLTAEPVLEERPWIRPEEMAPMTPFHITASDGLRIHGFLTRPRQPEGAPPPPLVVLPHGGPERRDRWGFVPEVQLLAAEGFAVLQVNFRGSAGYGRAFQEAGYRRWGDRVVQDIVDATRWVVKKGFADEKRVCSFGASFGGYAAVQSAILAPDLFRCAVGYSGIYDLELLAGRGDIAERRVGRAWVRAAVGEDEAALRAASPVHNAAKIKAKVLLVHGEQDPRAPIVHAERLRKALEQAGNAPEWLVEPHEAHGFYEEGAQERMYRRVIAFLRANTGAAPAAEPAAPPQAATPAASK